MTRREQLLQIDSEIDRIHQLGRSRMDAALDPTIRALRPAEILWLEPVELETFEALQARRFEYRETTEEIRQRVAAKRAARVAAANGVS